MFIWMDILDISVPFLDLLVQIHVYTISFQCITNLFLWNLQDFLKLQTAICGPNFTLRN
jgi:hypothetical protein